MLHRNQLQWIRTSRTGAAIVAASWPEQTISVASSGEESSQTLSAETSRWRVHPTYGDAPRLVVVSVGVILKFPVFSFRSFVSLVVYDEACVSFASCAFVWLFWTLRPFLCGWERVPKYGRTDTLRTEYACQQAHLFAESSSS